MNDVLLKGGTVIDGEKRTEFRADVLVRDGVIAEIGENIAADGAETVNCDGLYLTAGFIDAHVHVESGMVLPEAFGEAVLPHGTTAAVTDPHEIVNVAGAEGLRRYLDEAELSPAEHTVQRTRDASRYKRRGKVHGAGHETFSFRRKGGGTR